MFIIHWQREVHPTSLLCGGWGAKKSPSGHCPGESSNMKFPKMIPLKWFWVMKAKHTNRPRETYLFWGRWGRLISRHHVSSQSHQDSCWLRSISWRSKSSWTSCKNKRGAEQSRLGLIDADWFSMRMAERQWGSSSFALLFLLHFRYV